MARVDIVVTTKGVENADPTKAATGGQSAQTPISALNVGNSGKDIIATSYLTNQMASLGKRTLDNAFNFYKTNYGDLTGDYIGQTKMENAFENMQTLGSIVSTGWSAFKMSGGNVYATGIAVAVHVGSLAVNNMFSIGKENLGITKANANASFNSARLGAILIDGNRG